VAVAATVKTAEGLVPVRLLITREKHMRVSVDVNYTPGNPNISHD
jgi:hypothetical protein